MNKFNFGDIILLKFPFTDLGTFKKRPALVIQDSGDGDFIVCRITSQLYDSYFDSYIENWKEAGLLLPSVIRIHKIMTLQKNLAETRIGKLEPDVKEKVKLKFNQLLNDPTILLP